MKIIHTSDWHIGQDFYRYDREEEHAHFFHQLREIIQSEKPDALLVSGDIYHTALPSAAAQKLYTENMVKLHMVHPEMNIIVTAGNHDSYTRLESADKLWKLAKVEVVGNTQNAEGRENILSHHIKEIDDSNGKTIGYVIAIPYTRENNLEIFKAAQEVVKEMNRENLPVCMMGHLALMGSDISGHDENNIGGMDFVESNRLGDYYDYLALGHIHCPQFIKGSKKARYSGSPIQVNFDENYPHTISLVTIERHGEEPTVKEIKIENKCRFLTIPSEPKPFKEALDDFVKTEISPNSYVCLNVLVKDFLPCDAENDILTALKTKACKFCKVKITKEEVNRLESHIHFNTEEIRTMEPVDLANQYFMETMGEELEEGLKERMKEITRTIIENERI